MALVNCPECGNKVSDTAEKCPYCGYSIAKYIEEKKKEELAKQQREEEERLISIERQKLKWELEKKLNEIEGSTPPKTPVFLHTILEKLFCLAILAVSIVVIKFSWDVGGVLAVFGCGIGLLFLAFSVVGLFSDTASGYQKKKDDFGAWKEKEKQRIIKEYDEYAVNMAKYGQRTEPAVKYDVNSTNRTIKCPTCGSTNVKRISDTKKATHAIAFGIYSKTAFSQFECEDCHYKW